MIEWHHPEALPNQCGFEFVAKLKGGAEVLAHVSISAGGMHYVVGCEYRDILFWREVMA